MWVIGKLTYLKYVDPVKGYGIFAWKLIKIHSYIGEYTGRVYANSNDAPNNSWPYHFGLDPVKLIVDAYLEGSACRIINHSCDPNCAAKYVTHQGLVKIVIIALRNIHPDEELTINYNWEYDDIEDAVVIGHDNFYLHVKLKSVIEY